MKGKITAMLFLLLILFSGCVSFEQIISTLSGGIDNAECTVDFKEKGQDNLYFWFKEGKMKSIEGNQYIVVKGKDLWVWNEKDKEGIHSDLGENNPSMFIAGMKFMVNAMIKEGEGSCIDNVVTDEDFFVPEYIVFKEAEDIEEMRKQREEIDAKVERIKST